MNETASRASDSLTLTVTLTTRPAEYTRTDFTLRILINHDSVLIECADRPLFITALEGAFPAGQLRYVGSRNDTRLCGAARVEALVIEVVNRALPWLKPHVVRVMDLAPVRIVRSADGSCEFAVESAVIRDRRIYRRPSTANPSLFHGYNHSGV